MKVKYMIFKKLFAEVYQSFLVILDACFNVIFFPSIEEAISRSAVLEREPTEPW